MATFKAVELWTCEHHGVRINLPTIPIRLASSCISSALTKFDAVPHLDSCRISLVTHTLKSAGEMIE